MEKLKKCSKCKTPKSLIEFHKRKSSIDGHDHHCKECGNLRHRTKYANDIEYQIRMKQRNILNTYKLSIEDLNELYKITHCQICNTEILNKKCIDHNHKTGKVRGILCPKCNNLLGMCNDDIKILESAISYLKING